jgi:hypothetical protein
MLGSAPGATGPTHPHGHEGRRRTTCRHDRGGRRRCGGDGGDERTEHRVSVRRDSGPAKVFASLAPESWLTEGVPELVSAPAQVRPAVDATPDTDRPHHAHIVKVGPGESATAKVMEARIYGTQVEALCGYVWIPARDPKQLPLCQECKSIYDLYRSFNEDLRDSPSD